jgi:hypothetical protein
MGKRQLAARSTSTLNIHHETLPEAVSTDTGARSIAYAAASCRVKTRFAGSDTIVECLALAAHDFLR